MIGVMRHINLLLNVHKALPTRESIALSHRVQCDDRRSVPKVMLQLKQNEKVSYIINRLCCVREAKTVTSNIVAENQ